MAAILFKAQAAAMLGLNKSSCTSKACKWNSDFRKNVQPAKVVDIQLSRQGGKRKRTTTAPELHPSVSNQIDAEIRAFGASQGCVFTTSIDETGTLSSVSSTMPFTVAKMCDITRLQGCSDVSLDFCERFVNRMPAMFQPLQLASLEAKTRDQCLSRLWFDHRHGRLTASLFGDVLAHIRSQGSCVSLLNRICERQTVLRGKMCPAAIQWGRDHEGLAIDLLMKEFSETHEQARFRPSGLVVNRELPFLGASPDGIVTCECPHCPSERIVEVKCPFSIRDKNPREASYLDDSGNLVEGHKYYAQVQGQMAVTGVNECLFVVFTTKGIFATVVHVDGAYVRSMMTSLRTFYVEKVLPAMLTR